MSESVARPQRSLRSEVLPFFAIGTLVVALVGLFPRETFTYGRRGGRAVPEAVGGPAGCAFVTLTSGQEASALAAARTSWQGGSSASRLRIEMLPTELPEVAHAPVFDLAERPPSGVAFRARPVVRTRPPTVAAPPAVRLPKAPAEAPELAFPREALLRLR